MGPSEIIAALSFAVSLLSVGISYSAYRHSVRAGEQKSRLAFSREKSEFLVRIEKAREELDRLGERLEALLQTLNQAPDKLRALLTAEAAQAKSDRKYLEGCKRQVSSLYDETYEMTQAGLVHHKPRFLKLIEDDEQFSRDAHKRCDRIEKVIVKASAKSAM
ncbi:MAG: hypothetical protein ACFE0K_05700 [Alcanivorax sp.]|uniref:hypothetical protein n=1 Tax=Alcanivorax sp. TaxID=1872427 RepID=UPI003DA6D0EA